MNELKTLPQTDIRYRDWPLPDPSAVLLLVHGLGAHTERWEFLARFFLEQNIASFAIALKGFSEAVMLEGQIDSFQVYYKDMQRSSSYLRDKYPNKKIFMVGESLGGLGSFLAAILVPHICDGLVCLSPAFKSALKYKPLDYLKMYWSLIFNASRGFETPFSSSMLTRDAEYQRKMEADPRELRTTSVELLFQIVWEQVHARWLANRLRIPVLFQLAGKDTVVRSEESKKVFAKIESKDKQLIEYPELHHALSIEVGKEKVFEDMGKWMKARL